MEFDSYHRSVCGNRENNEDDVLVDNEMRIYVVADGMGGHAAGEVASKIAVNAVRDVLVERCDPDETRLVRDFDPDDGSDMMRERLRYAMNQASVLIRRRSESDPRTRGMGTTVVALVIDGDRAHLAHVGDSRAYLLRDQTLTRLTRDHTVVQQEIDAGRLTPELARLLPQRNILTQSVGFHGPVEPDTSTRVILPGDTFLLCSDGLTDALDDDRLRALMSEHSPEDLVDVLVETALREGAEDNVTVVIVAASE
ncbi:MAG TPA: protein phosphatase 2C domain-containing protein [Myxococcota bacterium]|nr:protein phosphatase 2C domain-containing protein [Myxococcota bacterium]